MLFPCLWLLCPGGLVSASVGQTPRSSSSSFILVSKVDA